MVGNFGGLVRAVRLVFAHKVGPCAATCCCSVLNLRKVPRPRSMDNSVFSAVAGAFGPLGSLLFGSSYIGVLYGHIRYM